METWPKSLLLALCLWPLLVDGMVRHYKFNVSNQANLFVSRGSSFIHTYITCAHCSMELGSRLDFASLKIKK